MQFLPQTDSKSLRLVIVILAVFYLFNGIGALRVAFAEGYWFYGAMAVGFWFPLTVGLWLRINIARATAYGVQLCFIAFIPMGIMGKVAGIDSAPMRHPPPLLVVFAISLSPVKWCNKSGQRSAAVPV